MRSSIAVAVVVGFGCGPSASMPRPIPPQPAPTTALPASEAAASRPPDGPPAVEIAETAPAMGDLGTSGIVFVEAAEPTGAWVLVCEIREDTNRDGVLEASWGPHGELFGDDPWPGLIRADGQTEKLDELVASDPSHRYLVVMRGNVMEILDTQSNARVPLPAADTRYEGGVFSGARALFTRDGAHVLYVRAPKQKRGRRMIAVRRLADGTEREVDPGSGELRDVAVRGEWVVANVFEPVKGKALQYSSVRSGPTHTVGARRCRPDVPADLANTDARWAPLAGGVAVKRPDIVSALGSQLITRATDAAVAVTRGDASSELAPAACRAVILDVSHEHESVLFACVDSTRHVEVQLWHGGSARTLGLQIEPEGVERRLAERYRQYGARLAVVSATSGTTMVDLVTGRTRPTNDYYPLASHGAKVLLHQRNSGLAVYDLATGAWTAIPGKAPDSGLNAQRGRLVAVGRRRHSSDEPLGMLVDLEAAKMIGTFEWPAHAVTTTGWILTLQPAPAPSRGMTQGPLRWVRATPAQ